MSFKRSAISSAVTSFAASLILALPCQAAFHFWRITEVYSSADGSVQFIELVNGSATTETQSAIAEIRTTTGNHVFDFPSNLTGNPANKRLLIATDNFELLPFAPAPDFMSATPLPPNFFDPAGDTIRLFQPNVGGEFNKVSYSTALGTAIPTDNVFSRIFNTACTTNCLSTGIAANTPTNYTAGTGSVNRGDYNGNGNVDTADYVLWRKTFGLGASPSGKGADGNTNGSIEDVDYTIWTQRYGNHIVGSVGGGGSFIPEPATIVLSLFGSALIGWRRRRS